MGQRCHINESFLVGTSERRAVSQVLAEVTVLGVEVGIEVDECERPNLAAAARSSGSEIEWSPPSARTRTPLVTKGEIPL